MTFMRLASDLAWLTLGDTAYVAQLPSGPIMVLAGPAAVIWGELAADGDVTTLTRRVTARMMNAPPDADGSVRQVVASLRENGLLIDTRGADDSAS